MICTWTWKILKIHCARFDSRYIGLGLEKCSHNLTGVRLILWYIGLGLKETLTERPTLLVSDWFYHTLDLDWLNESTK